MASFIVMKNLSNMVENFKQLQLPKFRSLSVAESRQCQ